MKLLLSVTVSADEGLMKVIANGTAYATAVCVCDPCVWNGELMNQSAAIAIAVLAHADARSFGFGIKNQ